MDLLNKISTHLPGLLGANVLSTLLIGVVFSTITVMVCQNSMKSRRCLKKLAQKSQQIAADRAAVFDCLPDKPENNYLCDLTIAELRAKLQSGEITSLELLHAFQRRTAQLIPLNCVAEVIAEATQQAKSITNITADSSPLCGIPVSLKEHIQVKGYDALNGCVKDAGNPALRDAVVVKTIRDVGAIPFVTTTMPPCGFSQDSSNAIFGTQRHPQDRNRLAGGSSGGEAVIIAGGGSPLGFGTDIAGSLRIPPSFCGICGLKPTFKRVSQLGVLTNYRESTTHIHVCVGPMARYVDNIADALRCLLSSAMFDADLSVPRLTFDERQFSGQTKEHLTIGYYTFIGGELCPQPAPSVVRAVFEAKSALEAAGHRLIPFHPPNPDLAIRLLMNAMLCDGGESLAKTFKNEPVPKSMQYIKHVSRIPGLVRRAFGELLSLCMNKTVGELIKYSTGCPTTADVLKLNAQISAYELAFGEAVVGADIDAILCPATAFPAPRADTLNILIDCGVLYTGLYNLVDYPAGVLPVSRVTEADQEAAREAEEEFATKKDYLNTALSKMQAGSRDLPVGVQVVGRPMQEETVLRVMREIESSAKFWG